jgi:hypothetical protein
MAARRLHRKMLYEYRGGIYSEKVIIFIRLQTNYLGFLAWNFPYLLNILRRFSQKFENGLLLVFFLREKGHIGFLKIKNLTLILKMQIYPRSQNAPNPLPPKKS